MTSRLPIVRPIAPAQDLHATVFENVDIALHELMAASLLTGVPYIQGRTFRGCRLVGPGVVMPGGRTTFDDTNFGDARGDNRNLVFKPMGSRATGAIVLQDCLVEGCEFSEVGFTGSDAFIETIIGLTETPQFGSLS